MPKLSDAIREKVNNFGPADLSVITICNSEKQAQRQAIDNLPIVQNAFGLASSYSANTHHIGNEALTEFRRTNFVFEKNQTVATLQRAYPKSKVAHDNSSGAYVIQLT